MSAGSASETGRLQTHRPTSATTPRRIQAGTCLKRTTSEVRSVLDVLDGYVGRQRENPAVNYRYTVPAEDTFRQPLLKCIHSAGLGSTHRNCESGKWAYVSDCPC